LYCGKCGAEIAGGADRCGACGEPLAPSVERPRVTARPFAYAGFWLRFAAFLVDLFVVGLAARPVIYEPLLTNVGPNATSKELFAFSTGGTRQALAIAMLVQLIYWLYYASLESSAWQASLGKKLLGLYVTDLEGKRISFARASGRHFGKMLSQLILLIGFVMAGFTARKQALHDMMAGCLVLKKL
jgi:uncharacterized RDD family membrane protein YckC